MLSPDCLRFRETFSPQDDATETSHRMTCEACDTYARRLEDAAAPVPSGLSTRLGLRLASIPDLAGECDDVDRLYAAVRRRARPGELIAPDVSADPDTGDDRLLLGHLDVCERCRRIYGCLEDVFTEPTHPLPHRLAERLQDIGRRAPDLLPVWISDSRFAAAACYVLTAFLMLLAGDASARFDATSEVVSGRAGTWIEATADATSRGWIRLVEGSRQATDTAGSWAVQQRQDFHDDAEHLRQALEQRAADLVQSIDHLELDPRQWLGDEETTPQGEDDGKPQPDAP